MARKPKLKTYEVEMTEVVKRRVTVTVLAFDAAEAKQKAESYDGRVDVHQGTEEIESNRATDAIEAQQ